MFRAVRATAVAVLLSAAAVSAAMIEREPVGTIALAAR